MLWALLINGLFWGGLFGGEALLRRLQPARQARTPVPAPPQPAGEAVQDLLKPDPQRQAGPPQPGAAAAAGAVPAATPAAWVARPAAGAQAVAAQAAALAAGPLAPPPQPLLSGADSLAGEITLASLREPRMLPAARAEQQRWQRSGNPLAPLPLHWQQRLKQELAGGPPIQLAQLVRVPVQQLLEPEEVAVLIDDAGAAEALNLPRQPQVRAAVEAWASRQQPAEEGQRQAVVIAAEPLPVAAAITPPIASERKVPAAPVPILSETAPPAAPAPAPPAAPEPAGAAL
jgi:hypothetical protein